MSLKAELNRLKRELAQMPSDGAGDKWVLPATVWAAIAGTVPWAEVPPADLDVWTEYRAWVERGHRQRDLEAELAALTHNNH